ncbi:MAG: divalent-cation tolerance protein CutA [Pseudomonadota bacterium]
MMDGPERTVLLYVTCPDEANAQSLGETLIRERHAACANILPGMVSLYMWEGALERANEVVLIVKTRAAAAPAAIDALQAMHPYETPAILQVPVEGGHGAFLAWVAAETS